MMNPTTGNKTLKFKRNNVYHKQKLMAILSPWLYTSKLRTLWRAIFFTIWIGIIGIILGVATFVMTCVFGVPLRCSNISWCVSIYVVASFVPMIRFVFGLSGKVAIKASRLSMALGIIFVTVCSLVFMLSAGAGIEEILRTTLKALMNLHNFWFNLLILVLQVFTLYLFYEATLCLHRFVTEKVVKLLIIEDKALNINVAFSVAVCRKDTNNETICGSCGREIIGEALYLVCGKTHVYHHECLEKILISFTYCPKCKTEGNPHRILSLNNGTVFYNFTMKAVWSIQSNVPTALFYDKDRVFILPKFSKMYEISRDCDRLLVPKAVCSGFMGRLERLMRHILYHDAIYFFNYFARIPFIKYDIAKDRWHRMSRPVTKIKHIQLVSHYLLAINYLNRRFFLYDLLDPENGWQDSLVLSNSVGPKGVRCCFDCGFNRMLIATTYPFVHNVFTGGIADVDVIREKPCKDISQLPAKAIVCQEVSSAAVYVPSNGAVIRLFAHRKRRVICDVQHIYIFNQSFIHEL
eukprot:TRINITY_DN4161_c0_g2_i1.p1 TRINITY_DN4161_c0_g2~~TRINITY_DN4161_c0_g2_i1.p1  ORF type:complete len:521 (+),score=22.31 TRINITY_DN4161_c0_g2_i1:149-1711(+)